MGSEAANLQMIQANAHQTNTDLKAVSICADDYGVDPAVDRAIVDLAGRGRLSATSVLVDARIEPDSIVALKALNIDVGLHLNFTEVLGDLPASAVMPLGQLILRSHARWLPRPWVRSNIERQLDRFESQFGRTPDYVDGHLHIHQLPIIRDELLAALGARALPSGFWVRDTRAGDLSGSAWAERFKSSVVGNLGMGVLARQAHDRQIFTNRGFFGVYDFTKAHRPFVQMMTDWLRLSAPGALVMTHPSCQALPNDPIGQARVDEYKVLGSHEFVELLDKLGVRVVRASQTLSSLP